MKNIFKFATSIILALFFFIFTVPHISLCMRAIPDDNLAQSILITLNDKNKSQGTGFYFGNNDNSIYLISAGHIFYKREKDSKNNTLKASKANLLSYSEDLDWTKPVKIELDLTKLFMSNLVKYDNKNDIVAIKIGESRLLDDGSKHKIELSDGVNPLTKRPIVTVPYKNIKRYSESLIGNEVFVSGYPQSLGIKKIPQLDYDKPLLRKGIVAGKNDTKKTLILDCPVFYGNSGSPVTEIEIVKLGEWKFSVIGVVTEFIPFAEEWLNLKHKYINTEIENSGYSVVVPMDTILELLGAF